MPDGINSPEKGETIEKKREVKYLRQVPHKNNHFVFNRSHTEQLKEEYDPIFENNHSTVYQVKEEGGEIATVDLSGISGSLLVYTENYMEPFLRTVRDQLGNDISIAQAAAAIRGFDKGERNSLRFVRAKRRLLRNSKYITQFLDKLSAAGADSDAFEKYKGQIADFVKQGDQMFGRYKRFGIGGFGWTFRGDSYTPNKPKQ